LKSAPVRRRRFALVAAAAFAVVPALIFGSSATAATNGNWWYSSYHVADATAAGWTGKGVKVAVIDSQIQSSAPVFSGTQLTVDPTALCTNAGATATTTDPNSYHGSDITSLLIGNGTGVGSVKGIAPDANVTFYAWGNNEPTECTNPASQDPYGLALKKAVDSGAKIVTTSVSDSLNPTVVDDVAWALSKGVLLVSSTPNTTSDDHRYPNDYNGVVAVNAVDSNGTLQTNDAAPGAATDVQPDTTVVAAGVNVASGVTPNTLVSGSSAATPLVAGMLADVWQKYPKATADQLIQSLVRNTTPGAGTDGYGHGEASLTKMLGVDPTTYPNTNPLMNKASGVPTAQQVAAAGGASTSKATDASSPAPQAAGSASDSTQAVITGVIVVVVVGLIIAAGIVLLVVFLVRRSRRSQVSRG